MGNRSLILLAAAGLLVAVCAHLAAPIQLASLPPLPKPVDQGTNAGSMLDDGSIVMELRT